MVPAIIVGLLASYMPFLANNTQADISNWQKSASIYSLSTTDFSGEQFKQSVRNLKSTGANYVSLVVTYYQEGNSGSEILSGWNTPTDASLKDAINYVHSQGMMVMLKPHIEARGGTWRALIKPTNRNTWYASYGAMLNKLAVIAQETKAEEICIGTELINVAAYTENPDNTQRWVKMIADVRARYSGLLTYSANWGAGDFAEEAPHIAFWDKLDYLGISAYYPLSGGTVDSFMKSWETWDTTKIKPLYDTYKKPIVFTEIGYRSVDGAHSDPWNGSRAGNVNEQEQANLYEALFKYWDSKPYMQGVHLWNWNIDPNTGGPSENHFTPQNKKAQQTMTEWFKGTGNPNPVGVWGASASGLINPVNTASNLSVKVTNSQSASDVVVDIEIYNASNQLVFQQVYDHQTISNSMPGQYTVNWTPTTTGKHVVKVGVFSNDWSKNLYWGNSVVSFVVPQGTGTPPTPPVTPPVTPPTTPTGNKVSAFMLIDAKTDKPVRELKTGDTVVLADYPEMNIQAIAGTGTKSVKFFVDGKTIRTESAAPYALGTDAGGNYTPWSAPLGKHTIKATPYSQSGAAGSIGTSLSIDVTFVAKSTTPPPPPPTTGTVIESLSLYNSDTDQPIRVLNATDTINLAETPNITIVPNLKSKPGSLVFFLNGVKVATETNAPYGIGGDLGGTNYNKWNAPLGKHTVRVVPYSGTAGTGTAGAAYTIEVTVVSQTTPPVTPPVTPILEISEPTEGQVMKGLHLLKARVTGKNAADYSLTWQVDGGGLVDMVSSEDGTSKESWVDFTGWTWKDNGPYVFTFIAKDLEQKVIGQKDVTIYVNP